MARRTHFVLIGVEVKAESSYQPYALRYIPVSSPGYAGHGIYKESTAPQEARMPIPRNEDIKGSWK